VSFVNDKGACELLFLWNVLRVYSWVFQTVLCGMAIALSVVTLVTGSHGLDVTWLPFPGDKQMSWLLALGVVGLICVFLAVTGKLRFLLFLFAIHSAYTLIKGLFLSSYSFAGPQDGRNAAILCAAAFLASIGSFPVSGQSSRR
jgi:hypothetical protein